ncbi:hypothetical protein K469DRAFT_787143 [Zopfia rhizophila CBS 207.26]|uniref:Rhodopsin domain-containing protein n=1 Tax=Zopfia rhizophila CBS 207.26 TaxID=1314779 RepID=A0A6A6DYB6_9PEZI|nr:hypothetical protein K469DRAFT_787143 [Zopfia rhizophila CBS 207.26]
MTAVDILLTMGRFIIHWRNRKRIAWDDIFNGIALLFLLAFSTTFQLHISEKYKANLYELGLTNHAPTNYHSSKSRNMKLDVAHIFFFWLAIYSVKASFLALYWQIFKISTRFRVAWGVLTAFIALSFGFTFLGVFWRCDAPKHIVNIAACEHRSMSHIVSFTTAFCALNVLGDILMMALPIAMLNSMPRMQKSQKLGLALVFSLTLLTIVIEVARVSYLLSKDSIIYTSQRALISILEPTIAVMICALPCYRAFLSWKTKSIPRPKEISLEVPE